MHKNHAMDQHGATAAERASEASRLQLQQDLAAITIDKQVVTEELVMANKSVVALQQKIATLDKSVLCCQAELAKRASESSKNIEQAVAQRHRADDLFAALLEKNNKLESEVYSLKMQQL